MAFDIVKLKKKVDKIISNTQLGATLTMAIYDLGSPDAFGKTTRTLNSTVISSGAKIGGSGSELSDENFHEESLRIIVPYDLAYQAEDNKLKVFTFMSKDYILDNAQPIDGIQDYGAGAELTLRRYEE